MRVIYDHQVTSLQNTGGITLYFYELIRNLTEPLASVDLTINLFLGKNQTVLPFRYLTAPGCSIHSSVTQIPPGYGRYCLNEIATSAATAFSGRYDIYHPTLYRCMPAVRARHIVVTHHDCIQERFPEFFAFIGQRRRIKTDQFNRATVILCTSESSRDDLLEFYRIAPERTRVIHLGVRPLPKGEMPKGFAPSPYILYVGKRQHYKNYSRLLLAFACSRLRYDFQLVCAGGGSFTKREIETIQAEGLQDKVISIPMVSEAQLGTLYRNAHFFVYPSLFEGFGLPPLEAMSCGTVPVVSRAGAIPEICQNAVIYFDPEDTDSMVAALEDAAYNSALRNEVLSNGPAVVAQYDWHVCALRTLDVYRELS